MTMVFKVEDRQKSGTGPARAVRRQDMVPGIVYGQKKDPSMISVIAKDILMEYTSKRFFSTLYQVECNGKKEDVLVKDVQLHPVTDKALHIDFVRVDQKTPVTVGIPVHFINEEKSPAIKRGGVLNIVIHELFVTCPPHEIPKEIIIDLDGAELHESITLDSIGLPKNVKPSFPKRDHVLATIVAPVSEEEEAAEDAQEESAEKAS